MADLEAATRVGSPSHSPLAHRGLGSTPPGYRGGGLVREFTPPGQRPGSTPPGQRMGLSPATLRSAKLGAPGMGPDGWPTRLPVDSSPEVCSQVYFTPRSMFALLDLSSPRFSSALAFPTVDCTRVPITQLTDLQIKSAATTPLSTGPPL